MMKNPFRPITFALRCLLVMFLVLAFKITLASENTLSHPNTTPSNELNVAQVDMGNILSWGQCPCFRWTVRMKAVSGKWVIREYVFSSDALLKFEQANTLQTRRLTSRMSRWGAFEAMKRGYRFGIGFTGVVIGDDVDKSYTDVLNAGLYAFMKLVKTDSTRLDLRSGLHYERRRINLNDTLEKNYLDQSLVFGWSTHRWDGSVRATMGLDSFDLLQRSAVAYSGSVELKWKTFQWKKLQMGLGASLSAEHAPVRESFDLAPDSAELNIFMDFSLVNPSVISPPAAGEAQGNE